MQPRIRIPQNRSKRRWALAVTVMLLALSCQSLEQDDASIVTPESGVLTTARDSGNVSRGGDIEQVSCAQYDGDIRTAVGSALVAARSSCDNDNDCVLYSAQLACRPSCPVSVLSVNLEPFVSELDAIADSECSVKPSSCAPFEPPEACVPVRPSCQNSTCVAQCDQPDWPETDVEGQFVREGAFCGDAACPAFPDSSDSRGRYAVSCCTSEGACGVFVRTLGPDCFEREPIAPLSEQCPSESLFVARDDSINVFDGLPGCCRADQTCGLDTSKSWGAGCVARADFARAASKTCTAENMHFAQLETIPCDYQP